MSERSDELKKLSEIAVDMKLPVDLRRKAIEQLGVISTHDALLALLDIAANENLVTKDRDLALKQAREVIKKTSLQ
ncbi:MAG: hypothetical protein V3W44_02500 [Dehalococcoidales bacterium]